MITPLIRALRDQVPMLVRSAPSSEEYLEGVFSRKDLACADALLREAFGQPTKEFNQAATFSSSTQALMNSLGGVRADQCLFLKQDDQGRMIYATLWPWASDVTRITLKVGVCGPLAG